MVWLKACPKCHGDLFLDGDRYGKFKSCVQCGYTRDVVESQQAVAVTPAPRQATHAETARLDLIAAAD